MLSYSSISFSIDLLTILLSIVLLANNRKKNKSIIYLSLFLIISALYIIVSLFFNFGGNIYVMAVLTNNIAPLFFLLGPLYYFFVRGMTKNNHSITKKDIIHFIPFFISLIQVIPYWFTGFDYKIHVNQIIIQNFDAYKRFDFGYFYPHLYNIYARAILMFGYTFYSLILIIKSWRKEKETFKNIRTEYINVYNGLFFITLVVLFVSVILIYLSQLILTFSNENNETFNTIELIIRVIFASYIFIPLFFIINPKLIHDFTVVYWELEETDETEISESDNTESDDYNNKHFSEIENERFRQLSVEVMNYLLTKKPFLRPDFKVHDICIDLNIPRHHVQEIINHILKTNFADLKNKLRIDYAKELLMSNTSKNISFEGIGQKAGFTSNSNFYKIFRETTGLTPSQWVKENRLK